MGAAHGVFGGLALALCLLAGALGGWRWYRVQESRLFWPLLRAGQALLVLEAVWGGALQLAGRSGGNLHVLYGALPVVVMFFAEQLRVTSAEAVLDARGLESAQAVGALPEDRQRSVVVAILRREMGVMVLAALVCVALGLRALGTTGWL
jgi:hypothetical protein